MISELIILTRSNSIEHIKIFNINTSRKFYETGCIDSD